MPASKLAAALAFFLALPSLAGAEDRAGQAQAQAPSQFQLQSQERTSQDRARCLTRDQQRAALADGKAVPLSAALRNLRHRVPGEVVRARLCHEGERLIYLLTVLPRDGKVRRAVVDASNGSVVGER